MVLAAFRKHHASSVLGHLVWSLLPRRYQFCFSLLYHQWSNDLHHISTPCFMNFHTDACLPDKLDLFPLKQYVFPLPSYSWQLSPSHQVTVISVFLGCHCKFAERKEFAVPGDYLCCVGCNHRVRKDCYRQHSGNLATEIHFPSPYHSCECHCQAIYSEL